MFLKDRQNLGKRVLTAAGTAIFLGWAFPTMAFVVSGNIEDSANNGVPRIQVKVFESVAGPDTLLATTYADDSGDYSVDVGALPGTPDIVVKVEEWAFQMLPAAALNNHLIKLTGTLDSSVDPSVVTAFTAKTGTTTVDHDPANPLSDKDLTMNEAQPARLIGLIDSINLSLNFYEDNKGTVTWEVEWDVPVRVRTGSIGSFFSSSTQAITIAQVDIFPATGMGRTSDIYHEMGHLVHYRIGNNLPAGTCFFPVPDPGKYPGHTDNSERNHGCAIKEGWASYLGELTDAGPGGANDNKYASSVDVSNIFWRGEEAPRPTAKDTVTIARTGTYPATGVHGNKFESGDNVEGAYSGVWAELDDVAGLTEFTDNFRVMVDDDPDNMYEFINGLNVDNVASAAIREGIFEALQKHGIVYNRPRFQMDPFDEMEPPDTAPAMPENYAKEIGGVMFLSGDAVTVKLEDVPKVDLGVTQTFSTDTVKIGYKTATDGADDEASTITTAMSTAEENFQVLVQTIDLDTKAIGDGDWDLVVIGKNLDGFTDNLTPRWGSVPAVVVPPAVAAIPADGTMDVNTDEKYLKVLGTWYDKDRDPKTNMDEEGKVAIDNTAPTINLGEFKPPP